MSENDDPGPDRPDVAVPVVPVAEGQPLSDVILRVKALRGHIENQQTVILRVWWQDSAGKDRDAPAELALSIPAAAKLADLLQQIVEPHLRYDPEHERSRQIRSDFRRRLAAFNHGAPACVGTLEAARCRIWLRSCRLIALSFDARGGDGVIWA